MWYSSYSKSAGPIRNIWGKKWSIISFFIIIGTLILVLISDNREKKAAAQENSVIDSVKIEESDSIMKID